MDEKNKVNEFSKEADVRTDAEQHGKKNVNAEAKADTEEVMRKEIQPGVIVRRRRRVNESGEESAEEHKKADELKKPEVKAEAKPESKPEARVVKTEEKKSADKSAEKPAAESADKAASSAPKANEGSTEQSRAQVKAEGKKAAGAPAEKSADKSAEKSVAESADKPAASTASKNNEGSTEQPKRKQKKRQIETPAARIITPAKIIVPAAPAPEVKAAEAAVVAEKTVATASNVAPAASSTASGAASGAASTVPAASAADASAAEKKPAGAKIIASPVSGKEMPRESRDNRSGRPAVSAAPDKDSSVSLLPPIGTPIRVDNGMDAPATTSQVRVISRPAPGAARIVERPSQDSRERSPRPDNRGPRPEGDRRPGGFRDGRPDNRPGGARPYPPRNPNMGGDKDRDADSQRRPMTPRPAPRPRPDGGFPANAVPVDGGADQSRKKRNKGRRTSDFGQNTTMADDFRRRGQGIIMDEDEGGSRPRSRSRKPKKVVAHTPQSTQPMKAAKKKVRVEEAIRVADLAHQMSVKSSEIIKVLFNLGVMATINNALDIDTATLVASEFGYEVDKVGFFEENYLAPAEVDTPEMLKPRPPVVTIMGHVDHGKTSLLDAIRKTSVTSGEAGGITQHIGAYHVKTKRGDIVFLDTPGHEAFTAMRARGAQVTDLVVLVVAADDGVMEQTREAINHSKAAGVPILVAVNKIDKPAANPDRVLRELSELGLQAESWGGDTVVGYVSAKTGEGLDDLLELIAIQAEILELKANPDKPARGHVIEAKLDKGRGPVATVLIQEGTIHQSDAFVCGVFAGRVRALFNDQGRKVKEAGPSIPVEVQGFEGVPEAGEEFICLTDEKAARRIAESRAIKQRERELAKQSRVTLETFLASKPDTEEAQVLNLVLKADVQGSVEAIIESLNKLSTEKVRISIIHAGAGAISESDIMLAAASNAIIIGFNVRPTAKVKDVADREGVDIRFYDIIYKLVEEIKGAMTGLLAPVSREVYLGQAEVRQTFSVPKVGVIAGSMVVDGKIGRSAGIRILRNGVVVYTGKVASLRRVKDDVKEVMKGFECGIGLENFNDVKVGDVLDCFETVEEAATL